MQMDGSDMCADTGTFAHLTSVIVLNQPCTALAFQPLLRQAPLAPGAGQRESPAVIRLPPVRGPQHRPTQAAPANPASPDEAMPADRGELLTGSCPRTGTQPFETIPDKESRSIRSHKSARQKEQQGDACIYERASPCCSSITPLILLPA